MAYKRKSVGSTLRIKKDPAKSKEKAKEQTSHQRENAFTHEELIALWKEFANTTAKKYGGFTFSILTKYQPELQEGNRILLVLDNPTNQLEFDQVKQDLLLFLRNSLQNDLIEITTEISEKKALKKLYTNKEKFQHLMKKNPELAEWVKRFDLEIDI